MNAMLNTIKPIAHPTAFTYRVVRRPEGQGHLIPKIGDILWGEIHQTIRVFLNGDREPAPDRFVYDTADGRRFEIPAECVEPAPFRPTCLADIAHIPIGRLIGAKVRLDKRLEHYFSDPTLPAFPHEGRLTGFSPGPCADFGSAEFWMAVDGRAYRVHSDIVGAQCFTVEILALAEMSEERPRSSLLADLSQLEAGSPEHIVGLRSNVERVLARLTDPALMPKDDAEVKAVAIALACTCDPIMKGLRGCRCGAGGTA